MMETRTLAATLDQLRCRGFTASFEASEGSLRVSETGRSYRPAELTIREHHRFEGASDPDDLAVVYAIEAADGTRGVLVDAFGPYANPAVAAVLRHVAERAEPGSTAA